MYAVVARFQFRSPATEAQVQQVERELVEPLCQQPGFRAYYGVRISDTEALAVHVWDSQADAEQAIQLIGPRQQQVVGDQLAGPPQRMMGEVLIHRQK